MRAILGEVQTPCQRLSAEEYNAYSVKLELQADYMAGVFAHHVQSRGLLDAEDFEEAMAAARAVGDDMIQQKSRAPHRLKPPLTAHHN
ncbi:MAG: hypothetical protein EOM03_19060, partial [Clostridia bacterium]|nr:hypothetical protein [Clostridia bacterium]